MASVTTPTSVTNDAAQALKMLLKTSKYSDLTIKCQDYVFKVHRSVVCPRSKFLAAAIDGQFKESTTGEIDLKEDEPFIVDKLVEFLYTADFDAETVGVNNASASKRKSISLESPTPIKITRSFGTGKLLPLDAGPSNSSTRSESISQGDTVSTSKTASSETSPTGPLVTLAKVYIMADFHDIPALKDLTKAKYETMVVDQWNDPAFAESIRIIYEKTRESDRDIKDIAIRTARTNIKALLDRGEFQSLIEDIGKVALDVMTSSVDYLRTLPQPEPRAVKCDKCNSGASCGGRNGNYQYYDDETGQRWQ